MPIMLTKSIKLSLKSGSILVGMILLLATAITMFSTHTGFGFLDPMSGWDVPPIVMD